MNDRWSSDIDLDALEEELSQSPRLAAEWTALNALRDVVGIALKGAQGATYKNVLAIGQEVAPDLFDPEVSLLHRRQLSETARTYVQRATASSKRNGKQTSALDLIQQDIMEDETLVAAVSPQEGDLIRKRISVLRAVMRELEERKTTENSLIFRDAYQVRRNLPISGVGRNYREFKISDQRALRIRVLHPDPAEHATGADLIYENYWETKGELLGRIAAVQYKIWNERSLRIDSRVRTQLDKLELIFCNGTICGEGANTEHAKRYRLPYCAAFLRPSNQIQPEDSRLISRGYYVPACVVARSKRPTRGGNAVVYSSDVRSEAVTHEVFEELFNTNMLGSRWLHLSEIEMLYRSHNILEADENIIIHAQELPLH